MTRLAEKFNDFIDHRIHLRVVTNANADDDILLGGILLEVGEDFVVIGQFYPTDDRPEVGAPEDVLLPMERIRFSRHIHSNCPKCDGHDPN